MPETTTIPTETKPTTYPSCVKCDATDYVYRGERGNEDEPCETWELKEGEPCTCFHCIEECIWKPLP